MSGYDEYKHSSNFGEYIILSQYTYKQICNTLIPNKICKKMYFIKVSNIY